MSNDTQKADQIAFHTTSRNPNSSSSTSTRNRVQPTPKHVLLEKWVLEFTPRNATHRTRDRDRDGREGAEEASGPAGSSVALSTIYKHGIPLFRSLFSLLRILPAWKVAKRLKRRGLGGGPANGMSVVLRVADPTSTGGAGDILGFGPSSSQSDASHYHTQVSQTLTLPTSTHAFPPVPHPLGTLTLTSTYLSHPNFRIDELESLLSSRFLSLEQEVGRGVGIGGAGAYQYDREQERDRERERQLREREVADDDNFVPTLIKNQQRESLISSGGTGLGGGGPLAQGPLPVRTSNFPARSPPRDIPRLQQRGYVSGPGVKQDVESIADRFVLPGTFASSSHGQGQGNVRLRTTSALSNVSMSPPKEILGVSRPSSVDSSRPAFPALFSTAALRRLQQVIYMVSGLSSSPPRATIPLPAQQQRDWVSSMSVATVSSTGDAGSGGAEGDWALGLIGASASITGALLHLVFLRKAKIQRD
ncbi:hypothetical protein K435DRAFT_973524 [Dendrothele bispora CBS 962.96]|uniref:Autophagy-related protein 13 n=1 Tax=Dendrothele bispora (strain CBS 962.96) TaxID=1314807 RepID=A0A4S8KRP7_DENBC|nr:hypothetical protein K435DRAFT_973524 [Dendrothele bispora CBS 962.96]